MKPTDQELLKGLEEMGDFSRFQQLLQIAFPHLEPVPDSRHILDALEQTFLPTPNESLAVGPLKHKTAALAFDRIHSNPLISDVPDDIAFYCGTRVERGLLAFGFFVQCFCDVYGKPHGLKPDKAILDLSEIPLISENAKTVADQISNVVGRTPTIIYDDQRAFTNDFSYGPELAAVIAISTVGLVDEKSLSWNQVREFRNDEETRNKYRRFVRWTSNELKNKTPAEVTDSIAAKLDDYEFALRKHGIETRLGTLSSLLDPKFLGISTAAALAAGSASVAWGALAGAGLVIGKTLVSFATAKIAADTELRKIGGEIAYVHEVKKQLGKDT